MKSPLVRSLTPSGTTARLFAATLLGAPPCLRVRSVKAGFSDTAEYRVRRLGSGWILARELGEARVPWSW